MSIKKIIRIILSLIFVIVFLCNAISFASIGLGQTPHNLEIGDAIFHSFFGSGEVEIWHVGIYTGYNANGDTNNLVNHKTAELLASGWASRHLQRFMHGSERYVGGRTLQMTSFERNHIALTASEAVKCFFAYNLTVFLSDYLIVV